MKGRLELLHFIASKGFTKGVEVGTNDGRFAEIMNNNIPALKLYCVDIWIGKWGEARERAIKRLAQYPNIKIIEKPSVEAAKEFKDNSLDFVYIDAAHDYTNVKADIEAWYPKVKSGGVLCGDDYYHMPSGNTGVIKAVDEFVRFNNYELQVTDWDDENPVQDERQPNWYFIKR